MSSYFASQDKGLQSSSDLWRGDVSMLSAGWVVGVILSWAVSWAQLEMDCARPQQARNVVGRLMLSEIEGAEDTHRAAMWEAFGRCPGGAGSAACRQKEQERFEAQWERQKKAIEDKYRKLLVDFEERCRASEARAAS